MTLWNPIKHVRDAWSGASTRWGKAAVILFYGSVWALIVANVVQVFIPMSEGFVSLALEPA